jgi:hypothetical protein
VLLSVQIPYVLETGWVPVLHVSCNMVIGFVMQLLIQLGGLEERKCQDQPDVWSI